MFGIESPHSLRVRGVEQIVGVRPVHIRGDRLRESPFHCPDNKDTDTHTHAHTRIHTHTHTHTHNCLCPHLYSFLPVLSSLSPLSPPSFCLTLSVSNNAKSRLTFAQLVAQFVSISVQICGQSVEFP